MKIKWWADAPRNGYMCLVVIWYWYKSTFERFLFRFSCLIGSLEVSVADLAIYLFMLIRSDVTFLWRHVCKGVQGHAPPDFFSEVHRSLKGHFLHFESSLELNIKVLHDIFLIAYLIILNKYFYKFLANFWANRPGNWFINFRLITY